jgi:hypothetical protein
VAQEGEKGEKEKGEKARGGRRERLSITEEGSSAQDVKIYCPHLTRENPSLEK